MDRRDEEEIRALIGAYAERLDSGDLDGVAALFEHGVFRSARGGDPLVGRDAVRRQYEPVILYPDDEGGSTPRTKHVLGNIAVEVHGAGATGRCTFTVLQQVADGPLRAVLGGRYHDRFARVDGRWRFAERTVHPDLLGDLSHHMASR
ncbi:MAG TPA: nuclear transport factor 2 family protein [Acidimicrobiia bacterium]|nr:nuclear transport factor 2 family protein [Acidimicrobiia bacterium]